MVYEEIGKNKFNTFALFFGYFLVLMGLGYVLGEIYGQVYYGIGIALIISIISIFTSYYYSDSIILTISGAEAADRKIHPQLFYSVEGLALAAGVPTPQIFVLHDQSINAFATGRNPKHSAIAVTEGALQQLEKQELEGVIGHEMSHIKDYDILVGSVSAVLVGMIVMVADWIRRGSFRRSFDVARRKGVSFIIFAFIVAILAPLAAIIISYAVSREREYMADAQSVLLTRYPAGLIAALGKIKGESFIPEEHNRALYHMYFASPLSLENEEVLFSTHPPLDKRIERLKAM